MLEKMANDFIDDECRQQCFASTIRGANENPSSVTVNDQSFEDNSGSDFCLKTVVESLNCAENRVYQSADCHAQCEADLGKDIIVIEFRGIMRKTRTFQFQCSSWILSDRYFK